MRRSLERRSLGSCAVLAASVLAWAAPLPPAEAPQENPATEMKRVLGKMLFWDEQLSSDDTVSCGTCHLPQRGGADPRRVRHPGADGVANTADDVFGSPGVIRRDADGDYLPHASFGLAAQVTGRNAPSALTGMFADDLFWDGRATGTFAEPEAGHLSIAAGGALESQVVGPPLSSVEMAREGRSWSDIAAKLAKAAPLALATDLPADVAARIAPSTRYPELFAAAFGDEEITAERIAFAVAAYERSLVPDQTPWDRYAAGDTSALTAQQVRGLGAFQASRCNDCHTAPEFTDRSFRNIGLRPPAEDTGRQAVTGSFADRGRFKVPSLRNVGLRTSFMHNGQFTTLTDVLRFYARAPGTVQFADNRDPLLAQINLPPSAAADVQALLATGLTDPRAAAGTFPFDRPRQYAENRVHGPALAGVGRPGTAGLVPSMIAVMPPFLGNTEFRLGVGNALGGAQAFLAVSSAPPVAGELPSATVLGPVTTASGGYATLRWPIPDDATRDGENVWFQWRVTDPAAAGGVALSRIATVSLFAVRSTSPVVVPPPGPGPDPDPQPSPTATADLFASAASFAIDWRRHADGTDADAFALRGLLALDGSAALAGRRLRLAVEDVPLAEVVLDADGRARSPRGAVPTWDVRVDASSGAFSAALGGIDLRDVAGLTDASGAGSVDLTVAVTLDPGDADAVAESAELPFAWATRDGRATVGRFSYAKDGLAAGALRPLATSVKTRRDGTRSLRVEGALDPVGDGWFAPTGDVELRLGTGDTIVFRASTARIRGDGASAVAAYEAFDPATGGALRFVYSARTRTFSLRGERLSDAVLVPAEASSDDVPLSLETSDGAVRTVFSCRIDLASGTARSRN